MKPLAQLRFRNGKVMEIEIPEVWPTIIIPDAPTPVMSMGPGEDLPSLEPPIRDNLYFRLIRKGREVIGRRLRRAAAGEKDWDREPLGPVPRKGDRPLRKPIPPGGGDGHQF